MAMICLTVLRAGSNKEKSVSFSLPPKIKITGFVKQFNARITASVLVALESL